MKYVRHKDGTYGTVVLEEVTTYDVVISWNDGDKDTSQVYDEDGGISSLDEFIEKWNKDENGYAIEEISEKEYIAGSIIES